VGKFHDTGTHQAQDKNGITEAIPAIDMTSDALSGTIFVHN
jgi:hypothetical protein